MNDLLAMIIKENPEQMKSAFTVMTRKQRLEKEKQKAIHLVKTIASSADPKQLGGVFDFEGDIFTGEGKPRKTRSQKKWLKKQWREKEEVANSASKISNIPEIRGKEDVQNLQKNDESLSKIRNIIARGSLQYEEVDGIIYRNYRAKGSEEQNVLRQLVLPKEYRKRVLEMAHDIPLAGHLGKKKTMSRILQRFFWPSISHDVKEYCRSCAACQKTSRKVSKAKMQSMPIIEEAFS